MHRHRHQEFLRFLRPIGAHTKSLDHVLGGIGALLFEGGAKSSQIYTRWLVAGNAGSFTDFMHERYAASATEAGTYVSGQVGQVATGLTDATIFLIWDGFLVVQGNKIMSLVPNANPAIGIVSEYHWMRLCSEQVTTL